MTLTLVRPSPTTHRTLSLNEAMEKAHNLAVQHVNRHGEPDREAWHREWDGWADKVRHKLTDLDMLIIYAYAMAALRYDSKYPYTVLKPVGLWAGRAWGNLSENGAS